MRCALPALVVLAVSFSCSSTETSKDVSAAPLQAETTAEPAPAPAPADEEQSEEASASTRTGVLIPASAAAIALWPEEYKGELLVLEVAEHGSAVAKGDVVAQLETRSVDEQLADAELGLGSARIQHEGLLERNAIAAEAAAAQLARAEAGLDRAVRAFAGYEAREREFTQRSDALSVQREAAWLADQTDELAQLEAMYEADELVDATEEIVLKRSRRDLAATKASNALSADRRAFRVEVSDTITLEARREGVEQKTQELEHLRRTQAIDARSRADAEARSAAELQKKEERLVRLRSDRELFAVQAPRAGVLLHGDLDAYREGGAASRVKRGSQLAPRRDAFLVAEPETLAVALDVTETDRATWTDGAVVVVRPAGAEGAGDGLSGRLFVEAYPSGAKGDACTFEATVRLDARLPGLVPGMHVSVELVDVRP